MKKFNLIKTITANGSGIKDAPYKKNKNFQL